MIYDCIYLLIVNKCSRTSVNTSGAIDPTFAVVGRGVGTACVPFQTKSPSNYGN